MTLAFSRRLRQRPRGLKEVGRRIASARPSQPHSIIEPPLLRRRPRSGTCVAVQELACEVIEGCAADALLNSGADPLCAGCVRFSAIVFLNLVGAAGCPNRKRVARRRFNRGLGACLAPGRKLNRAFEEDFSEPVPGSARPQRLEPQDLLFLEQILLVAKYVVDAPNQVNRDVIVPILRKSRNERVANFFRCKSGVRGPLSNLLPAPPHRQAPMWTIAHGDL